MALSKDALKDPVEEFTGQPAGYPTIGWHRHRWTTWGRAISEAGLAGMFSPSAAAFQTRRCVRCSAEERRRVPLHGVTTPKRHLTASDLVVVVVWGMLGGLVPSIVYAALDLTGAWR